MPKPRTDSTGVKHFGTILSHPQQYYRYKANKADFVKEDDLKLGKHYRKETTGPVHPYPGQSGSTIREKGVIYPPVGGPPPETLVTGDITAHAVHDHQAASGVATPDLGHGKGTLVVMRQEGTATTLRVAKKRGPHADPNFPDIGRTQHTTLTGGAKVAAAALLSDTGTKLQISSGHYKPKVSAAVKLAIHGKTSGTIDRRTVEFQDSKGNPLDMSLKQRMKIVSNWAKNR